MNEPSDLTPEDQVSYWIGRVVRKEAEIETSLRLIHQSLTGGLAWAVVPDMLFPLMKNVRAMLVELDPDKGYLGDCLDALGALKLAHEKRNRLVHDRWMQHGSRPEGTFLKIGKAWMMRWEDTEVIKDYTEFEQVFQELNLAGARVSGIIYTIDKYVPGADFTVWEHAYLGNRETIAGRISMLGNDRWEFTDPIAIERMGHDTRERVAQMLRNDGAAAGSAAVDSLKPANPKEN